jgi:hypothetical protein
MGGDIGFYGFPASVTRSFLFVLQEQPAEPRFGVQTPPATEPGFLYPDAITTATVTNGGEYAREVFQDPIRVAIPGTLFIPT